MEFLPTSTLPPPKNLYPCLATITVTPPGAAPLSRRLSAGSFGSGEGEENALKRVISGGGRRKSSFAGGANASEEASSNAAKGETGKWYWRVQAGVTDTHLVILPLSSPPNPLLTSPPAPLSAAMPSHSTTKGATDLAIQDEEESSGGILDKIKHTFRKGSSTAPKTERRPSASKETKPDRIIDQTSTGGQITLPASANQHDNVENGWPGILNGDKLGAILIPLGSIDKHKVHLGGGKKNEASWVTISVISHFQTLAHGMLESVGARHHESYGKSGTIHFEFDKEWIGAKAEAELLHHHITNALQAPAPVFTSGPTGTTHQARRSPVPETFQLRGSELNEQYEALRQPQAGTTLGAPVTGGDIEPDSSVVSSHSGKVAGV